MPTNLPGTDVVIVGMGAVGGVAALPMARAGLKVIGLEAGTWLTRRDFAPDEIRNNIRDWPMAVQKANMEALAAGVAQYTGAEPVPLFTDADKVPAFKPG